MLAELSQYHLIWWYGYMHQKKWRRSSLCLEPLLLFAFGPTEQDTPHSPQTTSPSRFHLRPVPPQYGHPGKSGPATALTASRRDHWRTAPSQLHCTTL